QAPPSRSTNKTQTSRIPPRPPSCSESAPATSTSPRRCRQSSTIRFVEKTTPCARQRARWPGQFLHLQRAWDLESNRFIMVQLKLLKNFSKTSFALSNSLTSIHSSLVCPCAISPGPNTTLGIPPRDSADASQQKFTPIGRL